MFIFLCVATGGLIGALAVLISMQRSISSLHANNVDLLKRIDVLQQSNWSLTNKITELTVYPEDQSELEKVDEIDSGFSDLTNNISNYQALGYVVAVSPRGKIARRAMSAISWIHGDTIELYKLTIYKVVG